MNKNKRTLTLLLLGALLPLGACSFRPGNVDEATLRTDARHHHEEDLTVSASVISDSDARDIFGVGLGGHGIQAVWIEVDNRTGHPLYYLPVTTDQQYFSPLEVSWKVKGKFNSDGEKAADRMFISRAMPVDVPDGERTSGFVFTNRDLGIKVINVDLLGGGKSWQTSFMMDVPGIKLDVEKVNFDGLYADHEYQQLDRDGLRQWLSQQPCCTTNEDNSNTGDPVNFVLVGDSQLLLSAMVQRGWDVTERIHGGSIWKTTKSFLVGSSYRYSPVSSLYTLGRPQDLALQKARGNIHQRNHLRLWRAPVLCDGEPVWLGQISRDIGVRFTFKSPTLTTHKIDPDVDEARDYLLQDMIFSQRLAEFGYVRAMPPHPIEDPGHNLTGDPFITDGLRLVMFFHSPMTPMHEVRNLHWLEANRDRRHWVEQSEKSDEAP
ncbi:MAG: LssY C-terminal domain-containing protein [Pseudomonadota bacterium]|uniref:LssY C-terminal domain-containing protein n=1 Tax=Alcanivorax sp. TaxID=1872427 RepID=UPI0025C57FA5|nr:LssY C-terminal domain-containing protein [Alcanivorax sp.]MED5238614.1 LssY C-terminal domain-containing protein [Pseudomonadota bacterium]MEE3320469.1 LssY C-terminal domain-containing protein [Pseudomonadota bacterium]